MEYVEGRPIDEYCDSGSSRSASGCELFRKVCAAVHFAHQNLVVHRDLKPGNILVTADGEPKLLDFGIAKLLDSEPEPFTRSPAPACGRMTPEYASPEQVRGEPITTASDVYSLGVLLYELLTGASPYQAGGGRSREPCPGDLRDEPAQAEQRHSEEKEVQRPEGSALHRRLAGDLDNIVLMAMQQGAAAAVRLGRSALERHRPPSPGPAGRRPQGHRGLPGGEVRGAPQAGCRLRRRGPPPDRGFSITVTLLWQRAVEERERSEAISRFLQDLFEIPDPNQSRGETVTAREVLDRGVERIDTDLGGQPELRAELMDTMGRVYRKLGLYEPAKDLLQEALRLRRNFWVLMTCGSPTASTIWRTCCATWAMTLPLSLSSARRSVFSAKAATRRTSTMPAV